MYTTRRKACVRQLYRLAKFILVLWPWALLEIDLILLVLRIKFLLVMWTPATLVKMTGYSLAMYVFLSLLEPLLDKSDKH